MPAPSNHDRDGGRMLDQLGLIVSRSIPPETMAGLLTGAYKLHGGVVRGAGGRIVSHLSTPAADAAFSLVPGGNLVSGLIANVQLGSISADLQQVLNLSLVNTALSGLTLATSLAGFSYLAFKIRQIDRRLETVVKQTKELKHILQSQQRAQLLAAVDNLRLADQAPHEETRRQLLVQSKGAFAQSAHHYLSQMQELSELSQIEAAEEFYTVAFLGSALCTSDLGMHEPAREEMSRHIAQWTNTTRTMSRSLLQLDDAARLLDARYVDALPADRLVDLMDFANDTHRGIHWIDDLRRSLGKGTLFTSAVRVIDNAGIDCVKKWRARSDVLGGYGAHFDFLAEKRISASGFAGLLADAGKSDSTGLIWVTQRT